MTQALQLCRVYPARSTVLPLTSSGLQEDSSVTRSDAYMLDLLERAGYTLLGSALQRNFPKGLFKARF